MPPRKSSSTARRTQPTKLTLLHTLQPGAGTVFDLAWSPDGTRLALACNNGTVHVYETEKYKPAFPAVSHDAAVLTVAWSPDGQQFAVGDGEGNVLLRDAAWGSELRRLAALADGVYKVAWSPVGRRPRFAAAGADGTVRLWDGKDWLRPRDLDGLEQEVYCLLWSPDGQKLYTFSLDGTVRSAGLDSHRLRIALHDEDDFPICAAWRPPRPKKPPLMALGYSDGTVRFWDGVSKERQVSKLPGYTDQVTGVTFSHDGSLFASKSLCGTVRVSRCDSWELVQLLQEPGNTRFHYTTIAFHPRELVLATLGDKDKEIRIWEVSPTSAVAEAVREKPDRGEADILFLAANPPGTPRLALDAELRSIRDELAATPKDRRLNLKSEMRTVVARLTAYLQCRPKVVHFAGHGEAGGELILYDGDNQPALVRFVDLAEAIGDVRPRPECVVLNACFSLALADALLDAGIRCVVGMSKEIDDKSAQQFATGFYRDLAFGNGYYRAFRTGLSQIALQKLPDEQVPRFATRDASLYEGEPSNLPSAQAVRSARPPVEGTSCPLWFGTNRKPNNPADLTKGFGAGRDDRIHYGVCNVLVPKWHKIGSLGSNWLRRVFTWRDDRLKLEAESLQGREEPAFWAELTAKLQAVEVGRRDALVFLHGYNVTFEGAALRAAQLGTDLAVPGIMAFFSWPSQGTLLGYVDDEASVEASEPFLVEFLEKFVRQSGAKRVHLIAHSMGNRGLLRSLQRLLPRLAAGQQGLFGQIILAAPDVDVDLFRDLATTVFTTQVRARTTLYTSSRDRALTSSAFLHGYARAGFNPPYVLLPSLDTIEVANVDLSLLGHGAFAEARPVLTDIHSVLFSPEMKIEQRMGLTRDTTNGQWVIKG
jgi:esterase/lipase superfamily enzyme